MSRVVLLIHFLVHQLPSLAGSMLAKDDYYNLSKIEPTLSHLVDWDIQQS